MQYQKPLVMIKNVFSSPMDVMSETGMSNYALLKDTLDGIKAIEGEGRDSIGIPRDLPSVRIERAERNALHAYMKTCSEWRMLYVDAIEQSKGVPSVDVERQIRELPLPDWNALTAGLNHAEADQHAGYLKASFNLAHSYLTQLHRKALLHPFSFQPVSVYGNVMTRDGKTLMGVRGGMSYAGGHMTIPAGSLYPVEIEGRVVVDAYRGFVKELTDETGLTDDEKDCRIDGVIGIFDDPTLCGFVYGVSTGRTEEELGRIWKERGNKEHDSLFFRHPSELPEYIDRHADRRHEISPKVDPEHPLLPSGAAVLLIGLRRESKEDFDRALDLLGGLFKDVGP